jgi:hypothetical protein
MSRSINRGVRKIRPLGTVGDQTKQFEEKRLGLEKYGCWNVFLKSRKFRMSYPRHTISASKNNFCESFIDL